MKTFKHLKIDNYSTVASEFEKNYSWKAAV